VTINAVLEISLDCIDKERWCLISFLIQFQN